MEIKRFLNLCAAGIGALGSIYVLKSFLSLTPTATARLAQSGWGFTIPIIDSVSAQRAESIAGAGAFLLALLLAIAAIADMGSGFVLRGSHGTAFGVAGVLVGAVWLCLHSIAGWLRKRHNEAARLVILTEAFDDVVSWKKFGSAYIDSVRQSATALFGMRFDGMSHLATMRLVSAKVGRAMSPEIEETLSTLALE